ncbi:MAG: homogentisate 1,2-dioxygenase [Pseudobdellovibrionaceae bacterium]
MHQYSQGKSTTQGHKGIPENHFEEEQGRKGFFGPVSHIIKPEPSTRWAEIEGDLRPHLYDLVKLAQNQSVAKVPGATDKIATPYHLLRLLYNSDIEMSYWFCKPFLQMDLDYQKSAFRNADADTLYFCHKGEGQILTEYGLLVFSKGSYINIPKCVAHTFICEGDSEFLVIQSKNSYYREPDRGMLGRNGFYDLASIGKPDLKAQQDLLSKQSINILNVYIQKLQQQTRFGYTNNYYDTVGWKGDFFPFTLHIKDLMPVNSHRVHLPPPIHTTFVAQGFVVCTFLPRPLETDKDALKVPFYHQNIDYDEVLFYHDGDFFSRDNLHAGMMTLHPAGFPHGPHPKAIQKVQNKTHTDEVAVMIDTQQPLIVDPLLTKLELADYWKSWSR